MGKTPLRAASCVFPRGRSLDSSPVLPDRAPDSRPPSPTLRKKEAYRAAERGRGSLLPTASFDLDTPVRARTSSMTSNSLRRATSGAPTTVQDHMAPSSSVPQSLRNRRSTLQLQDEEISHPIVHDNPLPGQRGVQFTWSDTFGKTEKPQRRSESNYDFRKFHFASFLNAHPAFMNFNRGQLFQAVIMLAVTCFVIDSYSKAMSTTEQLLIVKHDESMMMLHLKRLEDQAMHLHESVTRLSERGFDRTDTSHDAEPSQKQQHVDADLIKVQYDQLRQMEDELNHEVKSLQNKIRQTDRANIVRAYGEGPVQVTLEIDFATAGVVTGSSMISILLWYETPHAAWTLLDQIQRGVWAGARFEMDRGFAVVASPSTRDSRKKLDFVETGQKLHEPWTVGLSEAEDGELSLFINLQDNTQYHKHDVCIGKIIDGFDTLQRLTRAARNHQQHDVPVSIKKATASHLTRRESAGLI
jgi:cyclophilin family peptidyl-prolyl cis-trans isomerase